MEKSKRGLKSDAVPMWISPTKWRGGEDLFPRTLFHDPVVGEPVLICQEEFPAHG